MIHFLPDVWTDWPMEPELEHAIDVAHKWYRFVAKQDFTVTSLMDSHEHNPNSMHHEGLAVDGRIRTLSEEMKRRAELEIQEFLGKSYWVQNHPVSAPHHIHMQRRRGLWVVRETNVTA